MNSKSVYGLFTFLLASVTMTAQIQQNLAPGLSNQVETVSSIDIDGKFAVVGDFANSQHHGGVFFYLHEDSIWKANPQFISGADPQDMLGTAVVIEGNTVVATAPNADGMAANSGSAFIYTLSNNLWTQDQVIYAADGSMAINFGKSVDLAGNHIIVGAPEADVDSLEKAGAAYIFTYDGVSWVETQKLTASDAAENDRFGYDVAISGNFAVVSAPANSSLAISNGSAYIFYFDGVSWIEQQKLMPANLGLYDQFGWNLELDNNTCFVGALRQSLDSALPFNGAIYVFEMDSNSLWSQKQKLNTTDTTKFNRFGSDFQVSGDLLIASASLDNDLSLDSGFAYIFEYKNGSWIEQSKLVPDNNNELFLGGYAVAISDSLCLIGCHATDSYIISFTAYITSFDLRESENDICTDATWINCGESIESNTSFGTLNGHPNVCNIPLSSSRGVWYKLLGTGQPIDVSLCNSFYDTRLAIFSGSCDSLICIAGNDDYCALYSQVTAPTVVSEVYYIYISGGANEYGRFTLSVNCQPAPNNDCTSPITLSCGSKVLGSTSNATAIGSFLSCLTDIGSAPGIYFNFIGTGDDITLSLCNSSYDTKIAVFSGDCTTYTCTAGNDDACGTGGLASRLTFPSISGINYLIYITGYQSENGPFELDVICGDLCLNAPVASTSHVTESSVRLNWSALPEALSYWVLGAALGNTLSTIMLPGTETSFEVSNLPSSTTYNWAVTAICNATLTSLSPPSNIETFTTLSGCQTTDNLYTLDMTPTSVKLKWTAVSGAIGYEISGSALGSPTDVMQIANGGLTDAFNVFNLSPGTTYSWTVKTICPTGASLPAERDTFTTPLMAKSADNHVSSDINYPPRELTIYPNPANDQLYIHLIGVTHTDSNIIYLLFDVNGKVVMRNKVQSINGKAQVDLPDQLKAGVYQLQIQMDSMYYNEKVLITN